MTPGLFDDPRSRLEREFDAFHEANPSVYRLLCRFADEAIGKGRERLSINLLFERARWYATIETEGDDFKLNNNHRAYYARMWLRDHPGHPEFFETRRVAR